MSSFDLTSTMMFVSETIFLIFGLCVCSSLATYQETIDSQNTNKYYKDEFNNYIKNENDQDDIFTLWNKFPLYVLNNSTYLSPKCSKAVENFMKNLKNNDLDALKMLDATAKLPSGLLNGNVNQYGDFDECINTKKAQYCLAEIDLRPIWKEPYSSYKHLIHSHFAFQDEFNDPKHRVPGFTMIRWGFCLPSECTPEDLQKALQEKLQVQAYINSDMCQIPDKSKFQISTGDYIARLLFLLLFLAVITSTILKYCNSPLLASENKFIQILLTFSIQNNWNSLITIKNLRTIDEKKEIRAVHGIRALSALALFMSHKVIALFYNPYINRTAMAENFGRSWSVIGRTAIIYTDSFMLISGLLNANALLNDLQENNKIRFKEKLINRIFRITPNLMTVILFCTYVLPNLGSGPLWPLVVEHHSKICRKYLWRNLFYVHNYFGFENMCLTHTHQVGIDMQLFLFTPIITYLLWKRKRMGFWIIMTLMITSTFLRMWVTWQYNLSHMVHFNIPVSRMFNTANLSYILPTHRATIYLIGVVTAYILKFSPHPNFTKIQTIAFWCVALIIGLSSMIGPFHMAQVGYSYNRIDAILYAGLSPIFWGLGLAWTIYVSNRNYGGWFGNFLSWRGFQYFGKISYSFYLIQFPVFFYNIGVTKHVDQYKMHYMFYLPETIVVLLISTILTMIIEIPFQNINKIIFEKNIKAHTKKETVLPNNKIRRDKQKLG